MEAKLRKAEFTLEDFLGQLRQVRKMTAGQGMAGLLGMLPGVGRQMKNLKVDERQIDRVEAIILSMTPAERRNPRSIDGSRRRRIAAGSGTNVQQVNQLLGQFKQMQRMMKQIGKGKMPQFPGLMRGDRPAAGAAGLRLAGSCPYPCAVRHGRDPLANPEPLIRSVYAFVAYRIGAGHDAEDVTGEVFERALRYRRGLRPGQGGAARVAGRDRPPRARRPGRSRAPRRSPSVPETRRARASSSTTPSSG